MMTVLCLESPGRGRCAFIAGKKLGSAPFRSRCKRVMRAAARELSLPCQGYDLVFIARRKLAFAAHGKVLDQMSASLAKLGVTR